MILPFTASENDANGLPRSSSKPSAGESVPEDSLVSKAKPGTRGATLVWLHGNER